MIRFTDELKQREGSTGKPRVLIVDDYPGTAEVLSVVLERLGYECSAAGTGRHALAAVLDFDPQIILLDLGLPDLSGFEVAQMVRNQRGGRQRKIVALTGWATNSSRQRALDAGCNSFLVKPVTEPKLRSVLGEATRSVATN